VEALQIYQSDPVTFCREILASDPWEKQIEILEAPRDDGRVTVRAWHVTGSQRGCETCGRKRERPRALRETWAAARDEEPARTTAPWGSGGGSSEVRR
jgi:hypothetical protein